MGTSRNSRDIASVGVNCGGCCGHNYVDRSKPSLHQRLRLIRKQYKNSGYFVLVNSNLLLSWGKKRIFVTVFVGVDVIVCYFVSTFCEDRIKKTCFAIEMSGAT